MAIKVAALLALLLHLAAAFHAPSTLNARALRASTPTMKHAEYFTRLARAEAGRLRLVVTKSNNHIYGQIVDDTKHAIVAAASTMEKELREAEGPKRGVSAAALVGKRLAEKALAKGVEKVHFDRKGYKYHGRVAALADGAREGGLSF
ncbi:hypothetical protein AB1Y20_009678 [Prymnesium parvum]|uniref:Large ribosomal subunit protein uL18c n=1 Tax=Prymnesium parvum TaxID=97485 RepID=A0AB34K4W4_PRYPA